MRTLVQERTEPFTPLCIENLRARMWPRRFGLECSESSLVKIRNRVTNRLFMAANLARNARRCLPLGAGQQHLAPPNRKAFGRSTARFNRRPFFLSEFSDKKWCLHNPSFYHMPKGLVLVCTSCSVHTRPEVFNCLSIKSDKFDLFDYVGSLP